MEKIFAVVKKVVVCNVWKITAFFAVLCVVCEGVYWTEFGADFTLRVKDPIDSQYDHRIDV